MQSQYIFSITTKKQLNSNALKMLYAKLILEQGIFFRVIDVGPEHPEHSYDGFRVVTARTRCVDRKEFWHFGLYTYYIYLKIKTNMPEACGCRFDPAQKKKAPCVFSPLLTLACFLFFNFFLAHSSACCLWVVYSRWISK